MTKKNGLTKQLGLFGLIAFALWAVQVWIIAYIPGTKPLSGIVFWRLAPHEILVCTLSLAGLALSLYLITRLARSRRSQDTAGERLGLKVLLDMYRYTGEAVIIIKIEDGHPGEIAMANDTASGLLGYEPGGLAGLEYLELEDPVKHDESSLDGQFAGGTPFQCQRSLVAKDQTTRDVLLDASLIEVAGKQYAVCRLQDIPCCSCCSPASAAIVEDTEMCLDFLVDQMHEGVVVTNDAWEIIFANPAVEKVLGISQDELLGSNFIELTGIDLSDANQETSIVDRDETHIIRETWVSTNTIGRRLVRITCGSFTDRYSKIRRSFCTLQDITARKQAEESIRRSEEFNRAVIMHSPLGISVRTANGQLMSYNDSWQRIWAVPNEEILRDATRVRSKLSFDSTDEYLDRWQPLIRKVYTEGGKLNIPELRIEGHRPGSASWISQYFYAIKDQFGNVDRVVIITEDISERKRSEEALRENEQRMELAVKSANIGLWDWDIRTDTMFYNDQWARMLGYELEEITGTPQAWAKMVHPEDWPEADRAIKDHIAGLVPVYECEYRLKTKSGEWLWVLDTGQIVEWDNGDPVRGTGIHFNIDERKKIEAEREKLITELARAVAEVNTLSGMLPICSSCHKIRDDEGYWNKIELYISKHSSAQFSHSICPDCAARLYPDIDLEQESLKHIKD